MPSLTQQQCELLFPLVVTLDSRNRVLDCSKRMVQLLGRDLAGLALPQLFTILRPQLQPVEGVVDLLRFSSRLFLIATTDEQFAFRGQVIAGERDGNDVVLLVLTPWLSWLKEHRKDYTPQVQDYPLQDSQLDLEIYLHTQQAMMNDLRELAQSLHTANDQLTQAMKVRTKFLSYVSHELRTPLTGIISALPLFEPQALDNEGRALLDVMKSSSQSLLEIINQVLDFNEATDGSDAMHVEAFDFNALVCECMNICGLIANKKQLQLVQLVDGALLGLYFESDRGKLKKILVNLLGNAVKYTNAGHVRLEARMLDDSATQSRLTISIHDDGHGVLPEDVPYLFEPYWKKMRSTDPNTPSNGLGLSITSKLVEVLGGRLGYRRSSTLDGSEFWVELPLAKSAVRKQVAMPAPALELQKPEPATLSGEVLLVDDNNVNLMIGKLMLERAGMQVTTSLSAREAIEHCRQRRFSVILMDILMPEMNGLECSNLLRSEPGPNCDTPIIAWSAHCSREDMLRYTAYGINDWLIKPPLPAVLTGLISKWQHHRLDGRI
jgi:signal transduction histidine kinase/CheY-like chemotaxis protein